jgi:SSS family solute:Na+ symporter
VSWIDWAIVLGAGSLITWLCFTTTKYVKGVADFLSANRSAGRYMMTLSGAMAGVGAIAVVASFEIYYKVGFPPVWWELLMFPATAVILMSGWLIYRYRETRCLTMGQFYEVRYSRNFRIYAGVIVWLSGIVNFGIFPAVATRFFIYFCDLPQTFDLFGQTIPTLWPLMLLTLGLALLYTTLGGHISVMISDCVQGIMCSAGFVLIAFFMLHKFGWAELSEVALSLETQGSSFLNPYNTSKVKDFNAWFTMIAIFGMFYGFISWQGGQSYNSCALNPHEAKMGGIIGTWRLIPQTVMVVLIPLCVLAFLTLPKYAHQAAEVQQVLDTVGDDYLVEQVRVSVGLSHILPVGLKGLFCAMMLFFLITTQDTYLHSWGSIFIQDVVCPIRGRPFTPEQHLRLLRWSIVFVAVFAYVFSILYKQTDYIRMFQAITGAIVAGAGTVIIGGLYWRRGSTLAAWIAITAGMVISITRIVLDTVKPNFEDVVQRGWFLQLLDWLTGPNLQVYWFYTMMICIGSYVVVSLLTFTKPFNLERMLYRGKYHVQDEHTRSEDPLPRSLWMRVINITDEFSLMDRFLAIGLLVWFGFWLLVFVGVTIYSLLGPVLVPELVSEKGFSAEVWAQFWHAWVWINLILGIPITIWLIIGASLDLRKCYARLSTLKRDDTDDGSVPRRDTFEE